MTDFEKIFDAEQIKIAQEKNPFAKLNEVVYNIIENAIINFELQPGMRLSVSTIAELLNVSRTPVTEALELLKESGFVVTPSNKKGYYVFDISHNSLEQLFMARKALEGTAASLCARSGSFKEGERLRKLALEFKKTFDDRDFSNFAELDSEFHSIIIRASGNPYIWRMHKALEKFIAYYSIRSQEYMLSLEDEPLFKTLANQHMAIYNAIMIGIPELAETASKNHLETCYNLCMRYHTTVGSL